MNKTLLTAVSALVIMTAAPAAFADQVNTKSSSPSATTTGTVSIDSRMTADGMIGKPFYNESGESVAKIQDIILDNKGNAKLVVLADGAVTGLGKIVAFDYNIIERQNGDGDVIGALSEDMIQRAKTFSYEAKDESDKVSVMPQDSHSMIKLLEGHLVNAKGEKLADIDDISFKNGKADQLVLGFDKTLGLGGEKAALAYGDVLLSKNGETYDFKISASQAAQFEAFKNNF